jgi:hypothetical protein
MAAKQPNAMNGAFNLSCWVVHPREKKKIAIKTCCNFAFMDAQYLSYLSKKNHEMIGYDWYST